METNLDYFRRRAAEERLAARTATDLRARDVHLEMARRYTEAANVGVAGSEEEAQTTQFDTPVRNITQIR